MALTEDIRGLVPGNEAGVVAVAHALLQDPLPKVLPEAAAGRDQAVISAVRLRESAQDSPGHDPAIGEYR